MGRDSRMARAVCLPCYRVAAFPAACLDRPLSRPGCAQFLLLLLLLAAPCCRPWIRQLGGSSRRAKQGEVRKKLTPTSFAGDLNCFRSPPAVLC